MSQPRFFSPLESRFVLLASQQDILNASLAIFVMLGIYATAVAWWQVASSWKRRNTLLPKFFQADPQPPDGELTEPRPTIPIAAVVIIGCWLFLTVISLLNSNNEVREIQADALVEGIVLNACLTFALLLSIALSSPTNRTACWQAMFSSPITRQIRDGTYAFLLALGPVYLTILATAPFRSLEAQHPIIKLLRDDPNFAVIGLAFLLAVVMAPLFEELAFRVVIQGWLQSQSTPMFAWIATALLFSFVHGWPDSIALVPLALILGWFYQQGRGYLCIVTTHLLFNLLNMSLTWISTFIEFPTPE